MTGGGVWQTAPGSKSVNIFYTAIIEIISGQITDDGELAMSLALALSESKTFDLEKIATMFDYWQL